MGLVNALVAEHGRRVLLVTDEDKLKELVGDPIWKDQNEKIVGRRARIEADLESLMQASVRELPNGSAKTLLTEVAGDLLEVARASKVENLRNLSWAMYNATAFVNCLISDDEIPASHVVWTMKVVLATTLWLRSGLLDAETLRHIPGLSTTLAFRSGSRSNQDAPLDPQLTKAKAFSDSFGFLDVDAPRLTTLSSSHSRRAECLSIPKLPLGSNLSLGLGGNTQRLLGAGFGTVMRGR